MPRGKINVSENLPVWLKKVNEFQNEYEFSCRQMCSRYFPGITPARYKQYLYSPTQLPQIDILKSIFNNYPQYQETIIAGIQSDKIACPEIYKGVYRFFPALAEGLTAWIKTEGTDDHHG